uniref:Immunoglobulin V-set domain-containing protein n=1 Tax=Pundamilia nyererei TaxID=303518 RepID=A0A3B4FAX0_9CICH
MAECTNVCEGNCCNTVTIIQRYPLTFQCPYPSQHYDNSKFLCKGDHRNNCTNVTSQSRFTVQDDGFSHFFLVIIAELETADAGTYWCGSDSQWRVENYTKVELSVGKVNNHLHDSKINRAESSIFVWTPLNMGLCQYLSSVKRLHLKYFYYNCCNKSRHYYTSLCITIYSNQILCSMCGSLASDYFR